MQAPGLPRPWAVLAAQSSSLVVYVLINLTHSFFFLRHGSVASSCNCYSVMPAHLFTCPATCSQFLMLKSLCSLASASWLHLPHSPPMKSCCQKYQTKTQWMDTTLPEPESDQALRNQFARNTGSRGTCNTYHRSVISKNQTVEKLQKWLCFLITKITNCQGAEKKNPPLQICFYRTTQEILMLTDWVIDIIKELWCCVIF